MRDYLTSERGATAGEYALLLGILGALIAIGSFLISDSVGGSMRNSAELFATADEPAPAKPASAGKPDKGKGAGKGKGNGGVGHGKGVGNAKH